MPPPPNRQITSPSHRPSLKVRYKYFSTGSRSVNGISWNHLNDNIVAARQSRNNLVNVNKILIWFSCWLEFRLNQIDLCPENELPHPDWQFKLRCHVVCLLCLFNRASPLTTSIRTAEWTLCGFTWSTMHWAQLRNTRRFHSWMVSSSTYLTETPAWLRRQQWQEVEHWLLNSGRISLS